MGSTKNVSEIMLIYLKRLQAGLLTTVCKLCRLYSLPGPPLTEKSSIMELLDHNVTVGLGVIGNWAAQNTRFDLAWVSGRSTEKVLVCHGAQSCCILTRLPSGQAVVSLKQIHSHLPQQI